VRVSVEGVSFSYDRAIRVLDSVDLAVDSGELFALIGPNGSGKSTLLRLISGVFRPQEGRILLGALSVGGLSARRIAKHVAMVEQERATGFDFSVREIVGMGRFPHRGRFGRESGDDRRAIDRAMAVADVESLRERSIRAISGGERQRVFLALALAQEPDVLLLDEPTTHLDLRHQVQFLSIVRESSEEGRTALIAIHDLTLAAQVADRIGLMSGGRVGIAGTPGEVLTSSTLRESFGVEVRVGRDAALGAIYVLPSVLDEARPAD